MMYYDCTDDCLADAELVDISRVDEIAASLNKLVQQGVRECLVTLARTGTLRLTLGRTHEYKQTHILSHPLPLPSLEYRFMQGRFNVSKLQ